MKWIIATCLLCFAGIAMAQATRPALTADQARTACMARLESTPEYQALVKRVGEARIKGDETALTEALSEIATAKSAALAGDVAYQEARKGSAAAVAASRPAAKPLAFAGVDGIIAAMPKDIRPIPYELSLRKSRRQAWIEENVVGKAVTVRGYVADVKETSMILNTDPGEGNPGMDAYIVRATLDATQSPDNIAPLSLVTGTGTVKAIKMEWTGRAWRTGFTLTDLVLAQQKRR